MTSRTGMTESRWAYLCMLRPGFGHYLHVSRGLIPIKGADGIVRLTPWPKGQGKTYNVGRNGASIDRVVNTLGYIKGNVRVISRRANRMKGDSTIDDLMRMIAYMRGEI